MQKLLLIVSLFFLLPASSVHAGIAQPPTTRGLVGYWSMEDCKLNKATDNSGQGNTGTLTNFALTGATSNWVAGKLGACALNFDGSNDYVDTGLLVSPAQYPSLTISAWVKLTAQTGGFKPIVAADNGGFDRAFGVDPGSSTRYSIQVGNTAWTPVAYTTGVWQHVVVVYTSSSITFYLNGVAYSYGSGGGFGTSNQALLIGADIPCGATCRINGSIDDVRVYNRALTGNEIARLYGGGASHVKPATTRGLVGHWSFEDCKLNKASDDSGNGNTGTLTNFALTGTTSNWVAGKRGSCALNFDGTDDYVNTSDNVSLRPGADDFTYAMWIKPPNQNQAATTLLTKALGAPTYNQIFLGVGSVDASCGTVSSKRITFAVVENAATNNLGCSMTTTDVVDGLWHHIVLRRTSGVVAVYVDAVSLAYTSPKLGGTGHAGNINNAQSLQFGTTNGLFNYLGSIDDVRIYNRALSANEISDLYNSSSTRYNASTTALQTGTSLAAGLVGHWTFDGANLTSTKAKDSTTNLNHGALTGANGLPRPIMGQLGQALTFDGVDDYIAAVGNQNSTYSVSAWVNTTSSDVADGIVEYADSSGNRRGIGLASGAPLITYGVLKYRIASAAINNGEWRHVVAVYNGTTPIIYVDGVSVSIGSEFSGAVIGTVTVLRMGDLTAAGAFKLDGSLDDVRVYNRALSASEVTQLYNLGR